MMDNFDTAKRFDQAHDVFNRLCDAFVRTGGCSHDLGLVGGISIIQEWEKIRTEAAARDLAIIKLHRE